MRGMLENRMSLSVISQATLVAVGRDIQHAAVRSALLRATCTGNEIHTYCVQCPYRVQMYGRKIKAYFTLMP